MYIVLSRQYAYFTRSVARFAHPLLACVIFVYTGWKVTACIVQYHDVCTRHGHIPTSAIFLISLPKKLIDQLAVSYRRPWNRRSNGEKHLPTLRFHMQSVSQIKLFRRLPISHVSQVDNFIFDQGLRLVFVDYS